MKINKLRYDEILKLFKAGFKLTVIAKQFNVSPTRIKQIIAKQIDVNEYRKIKKEISIKRRTVRKEVNYFKYHKNKKGEYK